MCIQCVAQSAPFVGVAVTMLNRRNIKTWAADTWQKVQPTPQDPNPGLDNVATTAHPEAAPEEAGDATTRSHAAAQPVGAGHPL